MIPVFQGLTVTKVIFNYLIQTSLPNMDPNIFSNDYISLYPFCLLMSNTFVIILGIFILNYVDSR